MDISMLRTLIESIARALVDDESAVRVDLVEGDNTTIFELRVAQADVGKVIGKEGRMAKAMRDILYCTKAKFGRRRFQLDIIEPATSSRN